MSRSAVATGQVVPCLTFPERAEEAVNFYVSVFPNSRVTSLVRSVEEAPIPEGSLLHASFELDGRAFTAFDGGPTFNFSEGMSLVATCQTQEEIDRLWSKLSEGGEPGPCGWLKDRFGVSWQIVPSSLGEMLGNPRGGDTKAMMEALLKMGKLDSAALERAYRGERG
jgi:predicted 3-demethylubiquinone-9 3-methyltransferase (glyoxalase superfamily)